MSSCFNPRTPCGVRPQACPPHKLTRLFQSTHSLRSATKVRDDLMKNNQFQSTHSLRSATFYEEAGRYAYIVSIHALLAECDCFSFAGRVDNGCFNPRTPCGVRLPRGTFRAIGYPVSIHALLAECDILGLEIMREALGFQSTHSLRSATVATRLRRNIKRVSIHALLAECDCMATVG